MRSHEKCATRARIFCDSAQHQWELISVVCAGIFFPRLVYILCKRAAHNLSAAASALEDLYTLPSTHVVVVYIYV